MGAAAAGGELAAVAEGVVSEREACRNAASKLRPVASDGDHFASELLGGSENLFVAPGARAPAEEIHRRY